MRPPLFSSLRTKPLARHCERSEAIQSFVGRASVPAIFRHCEPHSMGRGNPEKRHGAMPKMWFLVVVKPLWGWIATLRSQ